MSFHNQTNSGRVQKIVDTLQLIQKSGVSNGIDREDMWNMLEPALNLMGEMLGEEPQKPEPVEQEDTTQVTQQAAESTKAPEWVRLREMLQKAPLKDLSVAMAVIMSRFDDELVSK
jgi:hypothetical protein